MNLFNSSDTINAAGRAHLSVAFINTKPVTVTEEDGYDEEAFSSIYLYPVRKTVSDDNWMPAVLTPEEEALLYDKYY